MLILLYIYLIVGFFLASGIGLAWVTKANRISLKNIAGLFLFWLFWPAFFIAAIVS